MSPSEETTKAMNDLYEAINTLEFNQMVRLFDLWRRVFDALMQERVHVIKRIDELLELVEKLR